MKKTFKDCFIEYEKNIIKIGNSKTQRIIEIKNNMPVCTSIYTNEDMWSGANVCMFNIGEFDYKNCEISFDCYVSDFGGKSKEALVGELIFKTTATNVKLVLFVFPYISALSSKVYIQGKVIPLKENRSMSNTAIELSKKQADNKPVLPEYGVIEAVNIKDRHLKAKAVRLYDETDIYNDLVSSHEKLLYRKFDEYFDASILMLENYIDKKAIMLVSEGYVSGKKFVGDKDFSVNENAACVFGNGIDEDAAEYTYIGGATLAVGKKGSLCDEYKKFYSHMYTNEGTYIMSNTWGDRKRDTAVCEEFMLGEIDAASTLGVDIVQIDDGWQQGLTANSGLVKNGAWGNFYDSDIDFWAVNKDKFPNGFNVISDYAQKKNVRLGLWFSMDKQNSYARWKQDADKILELHEKYGASYFKIDGLRITDHACEENIFNFAKYIHEKSDGKISFNFDITANRRYGYFMAKQYSTLFVENRYTDWQNYYPHTTLRNLWSLSEYIPAHKLQFEVLNQNRNEQSYPDDILKPSSYPIDYMFASVMVANPLIWMEMTNLDKNQISALKNIICVYKKERDNFKDAMIKPIGERPDGISYTGFNITKDGEGYLVLLKEKNEQNTYTYSLDKNITDINILASSCPDAKLEIKDGNIAVSNMKQAGYIFLKYKLV
ncbi:MAG: hypothetical protein E7410_02430 [Ruminococcaceae bacterium]|nr:hypothetical protein [Oscillospiraceae bacterium]